MQAPACSVTNHIGSAACEAMPANSINDSSRQFRVPLACLLGQLSSCAVGWSASGKGPTNSLCSALILMQNEDQLLIARMDIQLAEIGN